MTTNTARYALELFSVEADTYALRDATTGELVMMASGEAVYAAPLENALWTADMMNRTASVTPEAAPVAPEEESEPIRPRNDMDIAQAQRRRIKAAQERRESVGEAQPELVETLKPERNEVSELPEVATYPYLYGRAQGEMFSASIRISSIITELAFTREMTGSAVVRERLAKQIGELRELRDSLKRLSE